MSDVITNAAINDMEIPKAPVGVFELPIGLLEDDQLQTHVRVREITGREEDMLMAKNIVEHRKFGELLKSCVVELGSYSRSVDIEVRLPQLLKTDREFLLWSVRRVSLGDEYPYKQQCPKCEKTGIYTLDLAEIKIRPMPEESRKRRVFDYVLPTGRKVVWRPLTGAMEERLNARMAKKQGDILSLAMSARVETLDGGASTIDDMKSLGLKDRSAFREEVERVEGGLDDVLEMTCSSCGHEFEDTLTVGQTGFFFPSRVRKGSK